MKDEAMMTTSEDAEQMEYDHSVYVHTTLCIEKSTRMGWRTLENLLKLKHPAQRGSHSVWYQHYTEASNFKIPSLSLGDPILHY